MHVALVAFRKLLSLLESLLDLLEVVDRVEVDGRWLTADDRRPYGGTWSDDVHGKFGEKGTFVDVHLDRTLGMLEFCLNGVCLGRATTPVVEKAICALLCQLCGKIDVVREDAGRALVAVLSADSLHSMRADACCAPAACLHHAGEDVVLWRGDWWWMGNSFRRVSRHGATHRAGAISHFHFRWFQGFNW